ncbi:integrase core domain-containing protein [Actinomadura sp. HBU206391]|uniref:integrase core domain-containing protein n=1 Tax=Actinomadura sp. HBU206391 TaxID=2731692 RepID=UPI0039672F0D
MPGRTCPTTTRTLKRSSKHSSTARRSPGKFGSIEDANVFCTQFFIYYNNEHRHSGIGMHTPTSVHDGTAAAIQARRIATLHEAFLAHPERFRGRRPYPPPLPTKMWINQPPTTPKSDTSPQTTQVA